MFRSTATLNHSKTLRALLACALAACLGVAALGATGCAGQGTQGSSSASAAAAAEGTLAATLTVNVGDEVLAEAVEVAGLAAGATALDALEAGPLPVTSEESQYGPYVTAVGDVAADATHGWTYTVNGEEPTVSAGEYELADGDEVVWNYVSFAA